MNSGDSTLQPRLLLPIALAVLVIRGSAMPWITIRTFSGNERVYNLSDLRGGIAVIMTIVLVVVIGAVVGIFKRLTGMTIMSLGVATLGWMAAISGMLLTILWSLIPRVNVAGLDLAKATLSQGPGVVVTVIASLALAFTVVRQLDPFRTYTPSTSVPALPFAALVPMAAIAVTMSSEWIRLGTEGSAVQAQVAGDALYGSGLVVLGIWLAVGLWIGALMVNRALVISVASGLTVLVSLVVAMYAVFVWAGGSLMNWIVPAKLERWTAVSIEPQLYIVLISSFFALVVSVLGFLAKTQGLRFTVGQRAPGISKLYFSDVVGGVVLLLVLVSVIWQLV